MTAWWSGRAVPFDLETDGVDPTDARIITAAVADIQPYASVPALITPMARTERPIPAEATAVHGITTEQADEFGRPREEVVQAVATALTTWASDGAPVIGHNVRYDLTVLDREMRRTGVGSLGIELDRFGGLGQVTVRIDGRQAGAFWVIDTLVLDKAADPYRKGSRRLDAVAEHYGVPIRGDAHTADADAMAAGRVAWAIAKRCGEPSATLFERYRDRRKPDEVVKAFYALGLLDLPNLHHAQTRWAREQAEGLRDYFARTGKGDPAGVSGEWPLEPVGTADVVTGLV